MNTFKFNKYFIVKSLKLILFLFCSVYSQSYHVRTYTQDDGLPSSEVYDVTQDHSGRMWFATRNGVTVYDGAQWKTQTMSEGLPINSYSDVECDNQGTIWTISHFNDFIIAYLFEGRWQKLPQPDFPQPRPPITAFEVSIVNGQPVVAFGTNKGLYLWSNNEWKIFDDNDGLPDTRINSIEADGEHFYIGTKFGLFELYDNKIEHTLNESIDHTSSSIRGVAIDKNFNTASSGGENKLIWILGEEWLGYLENGFFKFVDLAETFSLDSRPVFFLLPDNHGGLYFGTPYRIYHFNKTSEAVKNFDTKQGLIADGASSAFMDYENNLWFTSFRGISKISNRRFANYHKVDGLLSDETTAIWEIKPGIMVFGHTNGITTLNNNQFNTIDLKRSNIVNSSHYRRVLDIRGEKSGNIWVASSLLGLAKIDVNQNISWYDEKNGLPGQVTSVLVDNSGVVWASTPKGIFNLQGNQFIRKKFPQDPYPRRLFQGPGNSIYVATANQGIILIDENDWKQISHATDNNINDIYAVLTDSQGKIWVGSKVGLFEIRDDVLQINKDGIQIDSPVFFIVEDNKNHLWFGTNDGVIKWDRKNKKKYSVEHGLSGRETNRAAGFVDSEGRMWIGTDQGLSYYQEEFDQKDSPPLVSFSKLDVSGKQFSLMEKNTFKYDQNDLTFYFKTISFINEDANRIQSKLVGYDENWSPEYASSIGNIRYTNLPNGRYTFVLKANNSTNVWSEPISSAEIYIKKPFWGQWWFYFFLILLAGFLLYVIVEFIYQKRLSLVLEEEVDLKTNVLQEEIINRKQAEGEVLKKMNDLDKMNQFMVGRELKMVQLKQEVDDLLEKAGKHKKYNPSEERE